MTSKYPTNIQTLNKSIYSTPSGVITLHLQHGCLRACSITSCPLRQEEGEGGRRKEQSGGEEGGGRGGEEGGGRRRSTEAGDLERQKADGGGGGGRVMDGGWREAASHTVGWSRARRTATQEKPTKCLRMKQDLYIMVTCLIQRPITYVHETREERGERRKETGERREERRERR